MTRRNHSHVLLPSRGLRLCRHRRWWLVPFCLVTALLLPASSRGQSTWDASPYEIRVWVTLEPVPALTQPWSDRLPIQLESTLHRAVGVAWNMRIQPAPKALQRDLRERMSELTTEAVVAHDADVLDADKLLLLAVTVRLNRLVVQVRELDCWTRRWGPTVRRPVSQPSRVALEAARALLDSFTPLVRIEKVQDKIARVRPRAAFLIAAADSPLALPPGTLLRPIVRRDDRFGKPKPGGVRALPWTVLEVLPEPGDHGQLACRIHTGVTQPLRSRRSFRIQQLALRIHPRDMPTQLRLVTRARLDRPLAGYDIVARDDESSRPTLIGRSDWRGVVPVPPGPTPLRILYVKNGDQVLARLPLVPGEQETATVLLPDDAPRLEAEGFVIGVQEQLIDLMVRRTVLIMRIRQRIEDGQLDEAAQLIVQLQSLPTRDDLVRELRNHRQVFATDDRRVRSKIDKLFDDLSRRLRKNLDPAEIEAVRDALARARQTANSANSR